MEGLTRIGRSSLRTAEELDCYDRFHDAVLSGANYALLERVGIDRALQIFRMVLCDHPEFYWSNYQAQVGGYPPALTLNFPNEVSRTAETDYRLNRAADLLLESISSYGSEYALAKSIYRQIATIAEYGESGVSDLEPGYYRAHSCIGCLLDGVAVCEGIAKAGQLMLQRAGIAAYLVTGTARDGDGVRGPHAWLLVRIEGSFYYMDPTWGGCKADREGEPSFAYFLMDDACVGDRYAPDDRDWLPICENESGGYFAREGFLLRDWDIDDLTGIFRSCIARRLGRIEVLIPSGEVYERVKSAIVDGTAIYNALFKAAAQSGVEINDGYQYTFLDDMHVVSLRILFRESSLAGEAE